MPNDLRLQAIGSWLATQLDKFDALQPASGDASFRRYFRTRTTAGHDYIVMDAPPEQEALAPFLDVTRRLADAGVHVPRVHAHDAAQGFALLEDFGSTHYLAELNPDTANSLYSDAFAMLLRIQRASHADLPDYDRSTLEREMALFPEWFLGRHFGLQLSPTQQATLNAIEDVLVANALEQPQVFVHRDYHSRNLMLTAQDKPGVLDYQDAVRGALTYDLVSLLRDAYVAWPDERVRAWALDYRDHAVGAGLCAAVADNTFLRWFDLMGLQRQLKVLGIFARLCHRDGKMGYLADLPRVLAYVMHTAPRYADTAPLADLLKALDIPTQLDRKLSACAR
ncbi:MAG: phosphotransferase [Acidihalobacter sp.]|uniref:aminoglycoside phosphotransferase family protein n=1 Tax=Acidihalobacter sp. TaxID=1872108 RepID=UPI00307E6263